MAGPRLTVKSQGQFSLKLQQLANLYRGKKVHYTIHVPPELFWWYYIEFGTTASTININGSNWLVFPGHNPEAVAEDGNVYAKTVQHPGIRAFHVVQRVRPLIQDALHIKVAEGLVGNLEDTNAINVATKEALEKAIELIAESYVEQGVTGTRPDNTRFPKQSGKLHGNPASQAFLDNATVVEKV